MTPRAQDDIVRPFWNRRAGTGYTDWMLPNERYVSSPMQRTPPYDPYPGSNVSENATNYGYVPEDVTW